MKFRPSSLEAKYAKVQKKVAKEPQPNVTATPNPGYADREYTPPHVYACMRPLFNT